MMLRVSFSPVFEVSLHKSLEPGFMIFLYRGTRNTVETDVVLSYRALTIVYPTIKIPCLENIGVLVFIAGKVLIL